MDVYDIPEDKKKEIIKYCYTAYSKLNAKFFEDNGIRRGVFMELMFDLALHNLNDFKDYRLNKTDYDMISMYARNIDFMIKDYLAGNRELLGINEEGVLIFNGTKNSI